GAFIDQSIQAQTLPKQKSKEKFTPIDKVLSICTGVFFGAFVGGTIGSLIGDSEAYNGEYVDIARGGLIGAGILPFLLYESWAKSKGVRYPLNIWYAVAGGNTTFSNHKATNLRLGYSFGIGRNYHLSDRVYLQGEAIFNRRKLFFPLQRIRYETLGTDQLWQSDVDFSVAYIDIALLTRVRVFSFMKARLNFALGPAMSVQVLEKTDYNILDRESIETDSRMMYDFVYIDEEPNATSPFFGLVTAIELEAGKFLLKASLNWALHTSNQIYPLLNETKLHTLMFSLGYRFSNQKGSNL
ncbi:MAG: PorT family protein, partial [candidate division KSB1 bacterium]|nr:PorT family protein [candidate division KSB1 bacterium]